MKYLFITDIKPFQPLLDFDINSINVDLHNDFECVNIKTENRRLEFHFTRLIGNEFYKEQNAAVIFNNVIESSIETLETNHETRDISTLDNFAKGDMTEGNKFFQDKSIKYFFIGFMNEKLIDIFCKEAIIFLW